MFGCLLTCHIYFGVFFIKNLSVRSSLLLGPQLQPLALAIDREPRHGPHFQGGERTGVRTGGGGGRGRWLWYRTGGRNKGGCIIIEKTYLLTGGFALNFLIFKNTKTDIPIGDGYIAMSKSHFAHFLPEMKQFPPFSCLAWLPHLPPVPLPPSPRTPWVKPAGKCRKEE